MNEYGSAMVRIMSTKLALAMAILWNTNIMNTAVMEINVSNPKVALNVNSR